jgi:hypothetical protein
MSRHDMKLFEESKRRGAVEEKGEEPSRNAER